MSNMITVIKCCHGREAVVEQIENTLSSLQQLLECDTIQVVYPYDDPIAVICDDNGKMVGKPLNRALLDETETEVMDLFVGTFLIVGVNIDEGEFVSLTDELQETYLRKFWLPDIFVQRGSGLTIIHLTPDGRSLIF